MMLALCLVAPGAAAEPSADGAPLPVDPWLPNAVVFAPIEAKFVRMVIHKTHVAEPCLDELEIYGPGSDTNLALSEKGAKASASSCLAGFAAHRIEHLNDGQYGNAHSWAAGASSGWAQIELPVAQRINRVVFSRDRGRIHVDRLPAAFEIQVSADGSQWRTVSSVAQTFGIVPQPLLLAPDRPNRLDFPAQPARYVRLNIRRTNSGAQPCIDELEIYGADASRNLGLAAAGAKASASSVIEGYAIHRLEHLNDGLYGNDHSWIAATGAGWAQLELPAISSVQRVVFSRDRRRQFRDRLATEFDVAISLDGQNWTTVKRVVALEGLAPERRAPGESPQDWAARIAGGLDGQLALAAQKLADKVVSEADVQALLDLVQLDRERTVLRARLPLEFNPAAIRRAVADLTRTYGAQYRLPAGFAEKLAECERQLPALERRLASTDPAQIEQAVAECRALFELQRSALLANPVLAFDELLLLQRKTPPESQDTYWQWGQKYGMTVNWSCDFRPKNPPVAPWWDEAFVAVALREAPPATVGSEPAAGTSTPAQRREVSARRPPLRTIFKAPPTQMLQQPELHFDADRLLFSMPGPDRAFQVFEIRLDGTGLRQITTDTGPDIDNGDPCYLPDGRIIFNSTRMYVGVPCEDGMSYVSNLCLTDADGRHTRMLTFDQESNWHPSLLNDGRVLYTRYEYANVSHQFGRLLFQMNPDGTGQREYYGSNSYWPNSIFYARAIPNHPTLVAGVVCGHHGPNKTGRLVLFDPARGRSETSGAVQTIPGWGKPVERIVEDELYAGDWPKFAHPWPLNDKYFLVAARLHPGQTEYAAYLVDVFDNVTELCRLDGFSLLEPIPLAKRKAPPVIPDRVDPQTSEATVYLANVYQGQALHGVPPKQVKQLRLFTYNYVYRDTIVRGFGHLATPGVDGPWEPRFLLGTVNVREDGSALFKVPANLPITVQPLDEHGRAVQQMRSWFTAMPGELLSCVGCHEKLNASPPSYTSLAALGPPERIKPWRGPPRGFDFELEVQPVLDRFCVGCHDGSQPGRPDLARKSEAEKLRLNAAYHQATESSITTTLTPAFIALHPYVRRPHAESCYLPQVAGEYLPDTSLLVQMLQKGHHNVQLDAEAWDRLYTWIDLGVPDQGSWKFSEWSVPANYYQQRLDVLTKLGGRTLDVEWLPPAGELRPFVAPPPEPAPAAAPACPNWPFPAAEATRRQAEAGLPKTLELEIASGLSLKLALIPPGEFVMGDPCGAGNERPATRTRIERPFYMGCCEVTNAQFAALGDPQHFSGHVGWMSIDWRGEGHPLYGPTQPVVRVSWFEALRFCRALSDKSGRQVKLPTEAQWEWACRAGSNSPLWYGGRDDDFAPFENLAGRELRGLAFSGKPKWYLRDDRFDDRVLVSGPVGAYRANPWGLHDMAGNMSEWTRSTYRPYPYEPTHEDDPVGDETEKVVRGGNWATRPAQAGSAARWKYPAWRKVQDVGFRVIVEP